MISLAEKKDSLNIKELYSSEFALQKRIRPSVDFSTPIETPSEVFPFVPTLPKKLKKALGAVESELDFTIPSHERNLHVDVHDWVEYLKSYNAADNASIENYGLALFLHHVATQAREGKRDIYPEEAEQVTSFFQGIAEKRENTKPAFTELSKHPDVLVWLSEVVNYQESTLTIPDYSTSRYNADNTEIPEIRRF